MKHSAASRSDTFPSRGMTRNNTAETMLTIATCRAPKPPTSPQVPKPALTRAAISAATSSTRICREVRAT